MNDNWLKDIHDKMSDFEINEPQGLWDDIMKVKTQEINATTKDKSFAFWKKTLTAAAIAGVILSIGYLMIITEPTENSQVNFSKKDILAQNTEKLSDQIRETDSNTHGISGHSNEGTTEEESLSEQINNRKDFIYISNIDSIQETSSIDDNNLIEESNKDTITDFKPKHLHVKDPHPYHKELIAANDLSGIKTGRFSIGIFSTGGAGSELNRKSSGSIATAGIGSDNHNWEDTPILGLLAFNRGKEIINDVKHHLPIKGGISFSYALNNRFGISSGVSYSNLTSDIFQGSENHYFSGKQSLHYIGIPINLKCNIVSWNNFDVYASGGVMGEKCISGSLEKTYVLDDKIADRENQNINEKPFQWSVNASAGLQFNISSLLGIYAEPGISYYFDDHSDLRTIYKDKPLNFNLNIGFRFTFGD